MARRPRDRLLFGLGTSAYRGPILAAIAVGSSYVASRYLWHFDALRAWLIEHPTNSRGQAMRDLFAEGHGRVGAIVAGILALVAGMAAQIALWRFWTDKPALRIVGDQLMSHASFGYAPIRLSTIVEVAIVRKQVRWRGRRFVFLITPADGFSITCWGLLRFVRRAQLRFDSADFEGGLPATARFRDTLVRAIMDDRKRAVEP